SLVLLTQSFTPAVLTSASLACPVPAPGAPTAGPVTCGSPARAINKVYVWRNGNWVASGTLAGNVTALATDPSTGDVTAVLSPEFAVTCGAIASSNMSASSQIAVAPCPAVAKAGTMISQRSRLMEWSSGSWTEAGGSPAPSSPIVLASADSGA